ncbi:protein of unknown function DUF1566 [Alkalidesulfovibrio alkalitolerans DSM 16529]|uniref:Lcl C-terminal domain-containing protein n=2 Tax=Alkalidesulfovibrio alkalitolerans TaxID=293256 RepID=S7UJB5_9BACT|nr:protein of unknown function DUF1566 [Alkalidesulfovibrio alkalitolerans DSM 16529]
MGCFGSGQDGELRPGLPWPSPRFDMGGEGMVIDRLTSLVWTRSANPLGFPLPWDEALAAVARWNRRAHLGRNDWRLPNRAELRSLVCHGSRRPALPPGHPFAEVFQGWVWTSTTAAIAPGHAWRVHLEGGRTFYGRKSDEAIVWPVAGQGLVLPRTGQALCFDSAGREISCLGTGQDGESQCGASWPTPRFAEIPDGVLDRLTGLVWRRSADTSGGPVDFAGALAAAARLHERTGQMWRLPSITELDSLTDCSRHSPALTLGHPFTDVRDAYWSSTGSGFDPSWAFCLYIDKGAVGVGHKSRPEFFAWAVRGPVEEWATGHGRDVP